MHKLIVDPFIEFTIYTAYFFATYLYLVSSLTKKERGEIERKDAFMHDGAKEDLSRRDATGLGQERGEANGSPAGC